MYCHAFTRSTAPFRRCFLACCLLIIHVQTGLGTDVLDNGAENTVSAESVDLEVRDGGGPTTLNIVDGAVIAAVPEEDPPLTNEGRSVGVFGSSILNLLGGQTAGSVQLSDNAVATLSGGMIGNDLSLGQSSSATLTGTARIDDDTFVADNAVFTMNGGEVNDQFLVDGSAHLTLTATAGPINDDLFIRGNARLDMAGGTLGDELFVQNNAVATITGGYIDDDLNANQDAVITVSGLEIDDSVDTSDNGVVHFNSGTVNGGFEAVGNSTINVAGGTFENIFSDGEVVLAGGGTINITGGTFGTAGATAEGGVSSSLGGTLNWTGGEIAGVDDGMAPTATVGAVLNGVTNVSNIQFGPLVLDAANNGTVNASDFTAQELTVTSIAGGSVELSGGEATAVTIASELGGTVRLSGGTFGAMTATLESESVLTIVGDGFLVNGIPVAELDETLNDPDAFIEETGELRLVAGEIEGTLLDGSPFGMTFSRAFAPAPGARLFLVPEPRSLTLMSCLLMVFLARARRRPTRRSEA